MNTKHVDAIANAVLYEGYMLYPYRPSSIKNRQRFNFGVLYPRSYSEAQVGSDSWSMQTECLIEGNSESTVEIRVRFLKLVDRSVRKLTEATREPRRAAVYESCSAVEVDGKVFAPWQEAIECDVAVPACNLQVLTEKPVEWKFDFPGNEATELLRDSSGRIRGLIARKQESVCGVVEIFAWRMTDGVFKLRTSVQNLWVAERKLKNDYATARVVMDSSDGSFRRANRDDALRRSLLSAHILLGAVDGRFVSLLDPAENLRELAAGCENVGAWPVLVGEGSRDTMLASPIILYDYPRIAPESPGDLFDGTEIDEILALRVMTMTDDEKSEMRNSDERARKILERTETLPMEHLMKLHGTLRDLHPPGHSSDCYLPNEEEQAS